jgi:hypothetical protein
MTKRPIKVEEYLLAICLALALLPGAAEAQVVVAVNDTVNFRLGILLQPSVDLLQDPVSQGYSDNFFLRRGCSATTGSSSTRASS